MAFLVLALILIVAFAFRTARIERTRTDNKSQIKNTVDLSQQERYRDISELLDYLEQRISIPRPEFHVQNAEYFFERLTYEAHDSGAVASVTDQVLRHYGLDPSKVQIETSFLDQKSKNAEEIRGQFEKSVMNYGKIRIVLKPEDSEFDTLIAIIMHECAHYFSEIYHTRLDDKEKNERLTDLTAIWLGAGRRVLRGYFPREKIQIGYLKKDECCYAVYETERRRQNAIDKSEKFRSRFVMEADIQTARINQISRVLKMEVLCGEHNQKKLHIYKEICRHYRQQLAKYLAQLKHAMSEKAYCEMNAQLLQNAQEVRRKLDAVLGMFRAFQPLTMEGLNIDKTTYAYYAALCEHAQKGNASFQFEMLQFYNNHPSAIASEEAKYLISNLEEHDTADAYYLLGCCYNDGICVPVDQNVSIRYWVQAAGLGSEKAEMMLKEVYKNQVQT